MKKQLQKLSSILLCFVMLVGLLPTTAFAADTTTIDTINIKGITAPVAGATPDASGVTTDTAGIKIKNPTWRDSDGRYSVSQFVAGGEYKLAIGFEAESGYTIADNVNVTLNIRDYSSIEILGPFHHASGDNGIIYMGYKIPAAGAPTTYTVTVNGGTASPAGPNTSGTAVTVTAGAAPAGKEFYKWEAEGISLTADDAKNKTLSFTMPARNVTLTATYVYEGGIIETANATVAAPVAGGTPSFTLVSDDETKYTATVESWMLVDGSSETELTASDKFESGKDYKINIRFTAKEGYQFDSDCTFTLNEKSTQAYVIGDPTSRRYYFNDVPEASAYTVSVNGGTASPAGPNAEGTVVTITAGAAPAGKEFYKWEASGILLTADGAESETFSFTMPANNVTLTARYVSIIEAANATVAAPVAGGTPSFTLVSDDEPKYTATVESWILLDGGSEIELTASDKFESGKDYKINIRFTAKEGYQFDSDCTFTLNEKSTQAYVIGDPTSRRYYFNDVPAAGAATHTVSFDANGGTGTMAPATGISGEYTLPACTFTAPSGKQFKAWKVDGVEKAAHEKITVTADTIVTAVWESVSEYTKKGDISAVEATATIAPVLGAKTSAVSFTITDPTDAAAKGVIFSGTSWYKKDASSIYGWTQCSNGVDTFEEGTYRLSVQLRSKSNDYKEYYAMSDATTFTVNGVQWNSEEPFRDNYATSGYGYRFFVSPEFTLGGKTLDSIAVTTPPTKTAYREGEDFNPAGMVVTATYTDSSTAPVILYTVTDGTDMVAGKTSVTISYTEGGVTETTTQPITVAKEYSVTVNGGTGNGEYIAGEEVSISAFVSTGMQFKEWQGTDGLTFTSGDKNSQTATFTMPAHDVTVTAVTGPAEYYVSVSGGSGTGMYEAGATVTIVADPPEAGKQFKEWSVGDGKVLRFTESDITSSTAKFVMPGEAVRISATYEDIPVTTYTVSFDANGGTGTMADVTGISGEYTLPENGFTAPDGKQFKAWSVGGVEKAVGDKITVTANTTVTAVWENIPVVTYTVSFAANGGTGTMADVTGISGEYTLPENGFTAPDGKQFKAWSVDGNEKAVGDKITVTADTTVTAVWETIPAGHICDIKPAQKVEPSCTEGGKEAYYKCEGCGKFYEDALGTKEITDLAAWGNLPKLGHTESDWKSDKDNHWKECTVASCGVIIDSSKAAHADANNDGKCDTCEYNVGKTPTNPGGDKPNDNPQTGDNSMMSLWIAVLFVSGFGVVTTAVYGKKRKTVK